MGLVVMAGLHGLDAAIYGAASKAPASLTAAMSFLFAAGSPGILTWRDLDGRDKPGQARP
jgi:hypothetical protein